MRFYKSSKLKILVGDICQKFPASTISFMGNRGKYENPMFSKKSRYFFKPKFRGLILLGLLSDTTKGHVLIDSISTTKNLCKSDDD